MICPVSSWLGQQRSLLALCNSPNGGLVPAHPRGEDPSLCAFLYFKENLYWGWRTEARHQCQATTGRFAHCKKLLCLSLPCREKLLCLQQSHSTSLLSPLECFSLLARVLPTYTHTSTSWCLVSVPGVLLVPLSSPGVPPRPTLSEAQFLWSPFPKVHLRSCHPDHPSVIFH